jgi:hypothetical protein
VKIEKIHLNNERNDAHFQFMTEFRDLVTAQTAAALKIAPQFNTFMRLYNREDEALKKISASAFTPKIHEADADRDETLTGMYEVSKGMCKHWIPATRDAARRVQVVLKTYKHSGSKPINEETSAIYNLVQELRTEKYVVDVETAGLTAWVNELERRNNAVETLVKGRFNEGASKTDVVLKDARRETDAAFWDICDIINVYVILEGAANYETFIRTLNEVIKKYSVKTHKHRHGTNGGESSGDGAGV